MPVVTGDSAVSRVSANDTSLNTYQLESLIQITAAFYEEDGVTLIDPTIVVLYIQDPNGVQTPYYGVEITRESVGVYSFELEVNVAGPWVYKWQGQGSVEITSVDVYFAVAQSVFTTYFVPPHTGLSGQPIGLLLGLTYA